MKYSSAVSPSRKFERIGSGIMRPAGSAIRPRMPASCEMVEKPPLVAPELAMVERLPSGSMCFFTASDTNSVVFCQTSITRSFCSCSVSRPRRKSRSTTSTSFCASSSSAFLSGGMDMSATASVMPDLIANSKPMALMRSATSVVGSGPHSSYTSAIRSFTPPLSSFSLVNWTSGGRMRLKITRPTVVSIIRVSGWSRRSPLSLYQVVALSLMRV